MHQYEIDLVQAHAQQVMAGAFVVIAIAVLAVAILQWVKYLRGK